MTRKKAMNTIMELITDPDIVFVSGSEIYGELTNKENVMYVESMIDPISLVLGVAVTTKRKVVLVIDDNNLLKFMNSLVQVIASKQKNIYIIVINTDYYIHNIRQPNLFNSIRAFKGLVFNMGFLVQDYTAYFETKNSTNKISRIFKDSIGPLISVVRVDNNRIYSKDCVEMPSIDDFNDFISFIRNPDYDVVEELESQAVLQLDKGSS
jgi:hypothetical protein